MSLERTKRNVSINQARAILGEEHKDLTDEQIQSVLDFMYKWAEMEIKTHVKNEPMSIAHKQDRLNSR